MWTKKQVKEIFEVSSILDNNLRRNGMCPSDLTEEEYLSDIVLLLNNSAYKRELIEENELG